MSHSDYLAQRRFDVLDGVRAVSILLVFTAHPADQTLWHIFHGASGVSIFFVLSGFLITSLLLREQARSGAVDLKAFYIRRLFRIYPLFFLVLGIYCVLIFGLGMQSDRRDAFAQHLPAFVLLFPEGSFINHIGTAVPFDGSWSIGIEEKFYLVWPLLGFVLLAALPRRRFAALLVLSVALTALSFLPGWPQFVAPYAQITYGTLAAIALHHRASYRLLAHAGRPAALGLVIAAIAILQFSTGAILQTGLLYPVYGVLVAIAISGLVTTRSRRATAVLRSRPMVYVGALSYGLYLVHNFGLNAAEAVVPADWGIAGSLLSTVVGLAGAFVVCHFLHRWFEEPLRKVGVRLAHKRRTEGTLPAVLEPQPAPRADGAAGSSVSRVEAAT